MQHHKQYKQKEQNELLLRNYNNYFTYWLMETSIAIIYVKRLFRDNDEKSSEIINNSNNKIII